MTLSRGDTTRPGEIRRIVVPGRERPPRRWGRIVLGLLGLSAVLAAAAPVAARIAEPYVDRGAPQLAAFAPWSLPVVLAGVLLLGLARWRVLAVLAVPLLLVQVWWAVPDASARAAGRSAATGQPVTVYAQNVRFGQADADRLVQQVREESADVLVITELTPQFLARVRAAGIERLLPESDVHPAPGAAGTGIWSRWRLDADGRMPDTTFVMPRAQLYLPGGPRVSVTGVHAVSPRAGAVPLWRADLAMLARELPRPAGGPAIVAGDFNSGTSHSGFRELLTATGLAESASAADWWWPQDTWPAGRRFPPLTRIDHVLVSPDGIAVLGTRTVGLPGTDHRGVVAELSVR